MATSLFVADTVNPVSPDQFNTYEQTCDSVADLAGFIGVTGMQVFLRGFVSPGDGGQGPFYWNALGTNPDDAGVTTVIPSGSSVGNGEWVRLPSVVAGVQNLVNAINFADGGSIASAATTNIGAASGNNVTITGTNTITSFGVVQAGTQREVTFAGALTLNYNATSLRLPTGANITTAAGDTAVFLSLGSGNWINVSYQRASGAALSAPPAITTINEQVFFRSGTYVPTSGMSYCVVEICGGGGGGGSIAAATTAGASGGGSGGQIKVLLTAAQIGVSQVVTINSGGTGGASGGNNAGSSGGTVSLGSLLSCTGGAGGLGAGPQVSGGSGGFPTVTVGTTILSINGGNGGVGGFNTLAIGGNGADSIFGQGGGATLSTGSGAVNGTSATGWGAGGAGACSSTSSSSQTGGDGGPGRVFITEYISG